MEEIIALEANEIFDVVSLPLGKHLIGYKWVFPVKVNLDGTVVGLKA